MNSADWWWDTPDCHPPGGIIVPLIHGSHVTQFTHCSGDKKALPMYLTICNIHSSIQNKFSYLAQIVLAFLPVAPNFEWNSASGDRALSNINQQVLCDIAKMVLEQVTRFMKGGDNNSRALWPYSNAKIRHCWPNLASWLANHLGHANHIGVKYNACPKCLILKDKLRLLIPPPDLDSDQ
jgi:hypothetical protein